MASAVNEPFQKPTNHLMTLEKAETFDFDSPFGRVKRTILYHGDKIVYTEILLLNGVRVSQRLFNSLCRAFRARVQEEDSMEDSIDEEDGEEEYAMLLPSCWYCARDYKIDERNKRVQQIGNGCFAVEGSMVTMLKSMVTRDNNINSQSDHENVGMVLYRPDKLQLKPRIGLDTANPYMNKGY